MQYIRKRFKLFLFTLFFWFLISWNFRIETIFFGLVTSFIVTIASKGVLYDDAGFKYKGIKLHRLLIYVFFLFIAIFKATYTYTLAVISGKYEPVMVRIKLDVTDPVEVGIIANSITLTPGTISVDVSGNIILVIVLAKPGSDIKKLEKGIYEGFERLLKSKEKKHA
jgi:multicomponent Na+:H+ antiporter subunit E